MLENHPYKFPRANLHEADTAITDRSRTKGVWFITIFYTFGMLFTVYSHWSFLTVSMESGLNLQVYFDSTNILNYYLITALKLVLGIVAVTSLFRMRVSAVRYWHWLLYLKLFSCLYLLLISYSSHQTLVSPALISAFIGFSIAIVFVVYIRKIEKKGMLS